MWISAWLCHVSERCRSHSTQLNMHAQLSEQSVAHSPGPLPFCFGKLFPLRKSAVHDFNLVQDSILFLIAKHTESQTRLSRPDYGTAEKNYLQEMQALTTSPPEARALAVHASGALAVPAQCWKASGVNRTVRQVWLYVYLCHPTYLHEGPPGLYLPLFTRLLMPN